MPLILLAPKAAKDLSEPDCCKDCQMAKNQGGGAGGTTDVKMDGNLKFKANTKGAKDGGKQAIEAGKGSAGGQGGAGQRPPAGR